MRVAFLIERASYYRLLGPIIDEALRQGWTTECWHDYSHARVGHKGYLFPHIEAAPQFRNGRPTFKSFGGAAELRQWLGQQRVDAVISLSTPTLLFGTPLPAGGPAWICLQELLDLFVNSGPAGMRCSDLVALHSDWWLSWCAEYFHQQGLIEDGHAFFREMAGRVVSVGLPELDQASLIDPAEVRERLGLPPDRPIVTLLPFPGATNPRSFWANKLFLEPNPAKRLLHVLRHRRPEYLGHVLNGHTDHAVIRALRAFCDRNGALLVIKSRLKTPIPGYAREMADRCIYDDSYYPATVIEAIAVSSLCVGFYSAAVTEAAALGVPYLCLAYSPTDYLDGDPSGLSRYRHFFNRQEGGFFQFRGVSTTMSIAEALARLPVSTLGAFTIDAAARAAYMAKFLGSDDRQSSRRLLAALANTLATRASTCLTS